MDNLYTVEEVAEKFKVNHRTVRKWIRDGKIKAIKICGYSVRITESEILRILEQESFFERGD